MKNKLIMLILIGIAICFFGMFITMLPHSFVMQHLELIYVGMVIIIFSVAMFPKIIKKVVKVNYKDYISLENIPANFEMIYDNLYRNHIAELEKLRKKIRWRKIIQYITYAYFFIGYFLVRTEQVIVSYSLANFLGITSILSFLVATIFTFLNIKHERKYKEAYKKEIVANFIKIVNDKLDYEPIANRCYTMEKDYKNATFDNKRFNRFYPDDYIEGYLEEEIFVKMCDIHIQNVTGSGKNRTTEEIFHGMFGFTNFNKSINTYLKISKNKLKILEKSDRIELDSEEFEKYFDVYSEDQNLTMRILTADTMEYLVDFYNKYHIDFEIVCRNNILYLRFFTGPMFEPKVFGNSMDKELLFVYYSILKFIVELTKKINITLKEIDI